MWHFYRWWCHGVDRTVALWESDSVHVTRELQLKWIIHVNQKCKEQFSLFPFSLPLPGSLLVILHSFFCRFCTPPLSVSASHLLSGFEVCQDKRIERSRSTCFIVCDRDHSSHCSLFSFVWRLNSDLKPFASLVCKHMLYLINMLHLRLYVSFGQTFFLRGLFYPLFYYFNI